jgi:hypothetical protein
MSMHDLLGNGKWMIIALAATLTIPTAAWSQKNKPATTTGSTPAAPAAPAQAAPTSNAPMEEMMLGYAALDEVMDKVAAFVCNAQAQPQKVLVLDLASLQNIQNFDSFYVNADTLRDAFSAMANAPGASSGIDTFADITSAVATAAIASNAETASSFTISDPSPALILLNKLGAKGQANTVGSCRSPLYAGIYGEDDVGSFQLTNVMTKNVNGQQVGVSINTVQSELTALGTARATALGCLANAAQCGSAGGSSNNQAQKAKPEGDPLANDPPQAQAAKAPARQTAKPAATPDKQPASGGPASGTASGPAHNQPPPTKGPAVGPGSTAQPAQQVQNPGTAPGNGTTGQDPRTAAFSTLDATYNTFLAGMSTSNATTGEPLLASILSGFRLRNQLNALSGTPVTAVYVNVAFAGGTQQDRKDLPLNLTTGDLIRYSGAVGVNVIVFTIDGERSAIKFSDFLRLRTPMEQMHNPATDKDEPFNDGDNLGDIPATKPAQADKKHK